MRLSPTWAGLRRAVRNTLFLGALATSAHATWSIVVVDMATGEVCIASATCLTTDLEAFVPVVRVGIGAAAAQSFIDSSGANRTLIWDQLGAGATPQAILDSLAASDSGHQTRQYGIVTLVSDMPVTFTGNGAGGAKKGVVGTLGTLRYAIQGNVLTGGVVVDAAEAALISTPGDLSKRGMAAMEAARSFGGDGRCSCGLSPTNCGAPPPSFTQSAYVAFIILARIHDTDDANCPSMGCADGNYFLNIQEINGPASGLDPVVELQTSYDAWRAARLGRPDQAASSYASDRTRLPADGRTRLALSLDLRDIDGNPATTPLQNLFVTPVTPGQPVLATVDSFVDHGDGTATVLLQAGGMAGSQDLRIRIFDGTGVTILQPDLRVHLDPVRELHAGRSMLSLSDALTGGTTQVPFTLNTAHSGVSYHLLGSASGHYPGTPFGGTVLPLNRDSLLRSTYLNPGPPLLPGSLGVLDGTGYGTAELVAPASFLQPLVGVRLEWSALLLGSPLRTTNNVLVDVVL